MIKGNPSEGGGVPLSPHTPRKLPHKGLNPPFAGTKANSSSCSPSPLSSHKDHRRELETLRAKLEAERLCFQEARRQFASEVRELHQAAEKDRRLLVDQLRSKWEQQRAWELHQLREVTQRQREAEIRQLMRWKEAELHEAQELLQQERDAAMRQARDLQRQLAKELVSRGTGSRGGGGGSSEGLNAEYNAKLQEVLNKLRWEVDSEQAARIRHLKAELELERSLFLKYILERFEGESPPVGCPHRFKQACLTQHPSRARPRSLESLVAACTPDVAAVSKPCSLLGNQNRCESPCRHPLLEEGGPGDRSCPEQPEKTTSDKEQHAENESKKDASVDLPPEGKVNTCNAAGECAQEVPPQHGWLSGNSFNQLVMQNKDLLDALMVLEQRCSCLKEQNTQLRQGSFSDKVKWLKRKTAELAAVAKRLDESTKRYQELRLLKQYENLLREVEEKNKRCAKTELELNTVLKENVRISEENSQLHEQNKRAEKTESENADLKEKLRKATNDRNSAVQLIAGLEAKIEHLEEVMKNMKELTEGRQQLESEHEKTLLELQKKEAEIQQLQQTQTEIKRQHDEEVQLLDAQVKEYFNLMSQEQQLQSKKSVILGSELPHMTCSSTGMSCPEIWEQETDHPPLFCNGNINDQDCTSIASVDLIQSPSKLRVFLARYNYNPFNGPNKNPELELPLTAGEYIYVCGDMDEDGFYEGELMNGKRGIVPSNLVEEVAGNDLISFIPSELGDICYNSLHEPGFRCRSASSEGESNSPDEETRLSLLSMRPEGTLCEVQAAGPYPRNLTLIKQSARSITIGWDPPQMPESCGEVLSYNIYVNAELHQNVKSGSEREAVIENLDLKRQTYHISVQSVTDKGNSDQMQCTLLVGNTCHIAPTLLNLRNITATSAEITWFPSNSKYTHTVCLNEKEYDVTKAGVYCYTFQDLRPSTQYSVKVEPLVPDEALVCPQGGLEQKSMEVTFTTPSAGPPDAPLDVQIRPGSSEDVLVASWLPVTVHESGLSNGVKVIGYAIYINGRKITEIMSPTAGNISLEVSQIKAIRQPQTLSVRTVSPFGESEDSVPAMVPSSLLKVHSTSFSKSVVPGLIFEEYLESEGGLIPATTTSVASSSFSHMCVPSVDTGFTVHFSTNSATAANDSAGQSSLENCDGDRLTPEPCPSSMEFEPREDKDVGTHNICLQGAPGIFPEKDQTKESQQSCPDLSKSTTSKVEAQEDKSLRLGSWQNSLADYSHHSDLSDIEEEEEEDQQTKLNIFGDVCKPEEKLESPRELTRDKIITTTLREAQTATNSVSNSGLRRNVAAGDSFRDDTERLFVALFDYDPSSMSPNSDADEEELPLKRGQVLKVIGEKDANGFYTGEREGRKGLVPCNMVSEIRIDSMEVKNHLLKKAYEG